MSKQEGIGKRLLIVINDAAFFVSHRLPVALAARRSGYEVHVATPMSSAVAEIHAAGLEHHAVSFNRSGLNPVQDLYSLIVLYRLFRRIRPAIVHLVTIKPVLYGGIAARMAAVPAVVAAVSGLGHVFSSASLPSKLLRAVVGRLYRTAFRHPRLRVIFQNRTDREVMLQLDAIKISQSVLIRGSGVDLSLFLPRSVSGAPPVVMMASRLLKNKGVGEFVQAAGNLRRQDEMARFVLVGNPDPGNPETVLPEQLEKWVQVGVIEYWGFRQDMHEVLPAADIVVLPSYYGEGLPKVLIEAAACGKAVITTDTPGCRDAVESDASGLLIPPRDSAALTEAIKLLLADDLRRKRMGMAGRRLAEREFSIEKVVDAHLRVYRTLL